MMAIFHDFIEKVMEVFMVDFSVFGKSYEHRLENLGRHKVSSAGIEHLKKKKKLAPI